MANIYIVQFDTQISNNNHPMALINPEYNLFSANSLPGRLLSDYPSNSVYSQCINTNNKQKPQVYGDENINES